MEDGALGSGVAGMGAWQGSRRKALERGGVRLPRQAKAVGTLPQTPGEWAPGLPRPAAAFSAVLPGCLPPNWRRHGER